MSFLISDKDATAYTYSRDSILWAPFHFMFPSKDEERAKMVTMVWNRPELVFYIFSFLQQFPLTQEESLARKAELLTSSSFVRVCKQWNEWGIEFTIAYQRNKACQRMKILCDSQVLNPEAQKKAQAFQERWDSEFSKSTNLILITKGLHLMSDAICNTLKRDKPNFASMRDLCANVAERGEIWFSKKIADGISDGYVKSRAYRKIASFCTNSEFTTPVHLLLNWNPTNYQSPPALREVSVAIENSAYFDDDEEEAVNVCSKIEDKYLQSRGFCLISKAMAEEQHWKEAIQTAHMISDKDEKSLAFSAISTSMAKADDPNEYKQAIQIADEIEEKDVQWDTFCEIFDVMLRKGKSTEVFNSIPTIKNKRAQKRAIGEVGRRYYQCGQNAQVNKVNKLFKQLSLQ